MENTCGTSLTPNLKNDFQVGRGTEGNAWNAVYQAPNAAARRPGRCASVLSRERLDDRVGDRLDVLVKHEVAAVVIAQLGGRQNLLHEFRSRGHDERVIPPPDDECLPLPVLQIGGPPRVVLNVLP